MTGVVTWDELNNACRLCNRCSLGNARNNVVVGMGNRNADIMFIGEGPGYHEDMEGLPFVGSAGQLLDKMLAAVELNRDIVYIANVVKCRPPQNRDPSPEEQAACLDYLRCQVMLVKPKILVCLGRIAATAIINKEFKITRGRGQWIERKNYMIMATYHPSALLRDEGKKRPAWEDFKAIRDMYRKLKRDEEQN